MEQGNHRQRWALERLAREELPAARAEALRQELGAAGVEAQLAQLRHADEEILRAHPPARVAAQIRARARQARAARTRWAWVLAPAAALLLGLAVWPSTSTEDPGAPDSLVEDTTRIKGEAARLHIFRRTGAGVERLGPKAPTAAGDQLQLRYQSSGARFGVIVSVDGRGVVTPHLPLEGDSAAPLSAGEFDLPQSYELDDAPGFERFFLITSDAPFSRAAALGAVERLVKTSGASSAPLVLPAGLSQFSLLLVKRPRGAVNEVTP